MKHTKLASAVFAATALGATASNAATINFNAFGDTISGVSSLDWKPGSAYIKGGVGATAQNGDLTDVFVHGSLGSFLDSNGQSITNDFGLNSDYEVTFTATFEQVIFGISNSLNPVTGEIIQTLNFAKTSLSNSSFNIYIDDTTNSNPLAGTGFNDGTLISSGEISSGDGNISSVFIDDGTGEISTNPDDYGLLDQFGADDWNDTRTNSGIGGALFNAQSDFVNEDYIMPYTQDGVAWNGINFDLAFNSSQTVAFKETNPSKSYTDANGNSVVADTGAINGVNGEGVVLQVDGNSSFTTEPKELSNPGILMLLGIGMLAGFVSRKR